MDSTQASAVEDESAQVLQGRKKRIFWGINHTTLRRFEAKLITELGYELFLPKILPQDEGNRSASVDLSYDATLTMPSTVLEILNQQDYYGQPLGGTHIDLLNRYFDAAIVAFFPVMLDQFVRFFRGKILLRPFGLVKGFSYMDLCRDHLPADFFANLENARNRFFFAQAYPTLSSVEHGIFLNRAVTLPIGLPEIVKADSWRGELPKILFVCPRINSSPYYRTIYENFKKQFGDFSHVIAGAQPIEVSGDSSVSGFVSRETLNDWIQTHRVMYYHSSEPRHLHYHPLEAIQAGMPLIFMKESMLYEIGGRDQAGACESAAEARAKLGRLLDGDTALTATIVKQQRRMLDQFSWQSCLPEWERCLTEKVFINDTSPPNRRKRIAVFLPIAYRGGTLNIAINQAVMLKKGSEASGEGVDVVFSYVKGDYNTERDFHQLRENGISLRETNWQTISKEELRIATKFRGVECRLDAPEYIFPGDGASNFLDCDFWHIISDRTSAPLAPIRPYSIFVTDCLQRYMPELFGTHYESGFHATTRHASVVLCSMPFNRDDIIQYVGVAAQKIALFPLEFNPLLPPARPATHGDRKERAYFIWTTNAAMHKNHELALRGIRRYFEQLEGQLNVVVTGVDSDKFNPKTDPGEASAYVRRVRLQLETSKLMSRRIKWLGNLDQDDYARVLGAAEFLFHPTLIDAGTLSAAEAAGFGVPTLSNDYPPMRFYDQRFKLGIVFFDGTDENEIARALKYAETNLAELKERLPSPTDLARFGLDSLAPALWKLVRQHVQ